MDDRDGELFGDGNCVVGASIGTKNDGNGDGEILLCVLNRAQDRAQTSFYISFFIVCGNDERDVLSACAIRGQDYLNILWWKDTITRWNVSVSTT